MAPASYAGIRLAMRSSLQSRLMGPPSADAWSSGELMGWSNARYAVRTASPGRPVWETVSIMADPRHAATAVEPSTGSATGVLLTHADFDALVRELEALRRTHRDELARRLREARAFGTSTENDDLLTVLEESAVGSARIAQLEELVRVASVVEGAAGDGGAGLGSTVGVADDRGRVTRYELIGRRSDNSNPHEVTFASPVGQALWGAHPGDVVNVALPSGRSRTLRVLDVRHGPLTAAGDERAA
jgi:transcription elongation factor GreA